MSDTPSPNTLCIRALSRGFCVAIMKVIRRGGRAVLFPSTNPLKECSHDNHPDTRHSRRVSWYDGLMQFQIHIPEKVSLNQALRKHYKVVNALKQEWHMAVLDARPPAWDGPFPVDIRYVYRMHGRPMDSTN